MTLPLTMIRAFAKVYETGGVRAAARQLNITHSAVSRHVRELEAWVGTPLIARREGKRSPAFTAEGDALGRAAFACISELETTVAAIREAKRSNAVTISTTPSFATRWLIPRLSSFETQHPWIQLSVVVNQRLRTPADEGADVSIRMGSGPWAGLHCQPLMDDTLYPVMSPAYWEANGRPGSVSDLPRLRLLHDRDPNASWSKWKEQWGPSTLDIRTGSRLTSSDLVLCGAEHHLGVALARERLLADALASGRLIKPLGEAQLHLPDAFWIVLRDTSSRREAVELVVDWLKLAASTLPFHEDSHHLC